MCIGLWLLKEPYGQAEQLTLYHLPTNLAEWAKLSFYFSSF